MLNSTRSMDNCNRPLEKGGECKYAEKYECQTYYFSIPVRF